MVRLSSYLLALVCLLACSSIATWLALSSGFAPLVSVSTVECRLTVKMRWPAKYKPCPAIKLKPTKAGAADRDRTGITALGGQRSTIELQPLWRS